MLQVVLSLLTPLALTACNKTPPLVMLPPVVEVAAAAADVSARDLFLSGTIEADRAILLDFPVFGTIQEVSVTEGQEVAQGQVLARVAARSYEDALGIAQAKADQAEDAIRRLEPMYRNHTVAEVRWVEAQTGCEQARRAASLARKNVEDCALRAPVAGVIARRLAEPGVTASPGRPVVLLVETDGILTAAPVPEVEIARVRVGQPAVVRVKAIGVECRGEVKEIGVIADPLTRTYPVKVRLLSPGSALRIGMLAEVQLKSDASTEAVVVPRTAIRIDEAGVPVIYVLDREVIRRRAVAVAGYRGEAIAISSGLSAGEQVVTSGTSMLADGIRVRVARSRALAR